MLVLSRRIRERIYIGEEIEITVLRVSGGKVRLGIECDKTIPIRRHELLDQPNHSDDAASRGRAGEDT